MILPAETGELGGLTSAMASLKLKKGSSSHTMYPSTSSQIPALHSAFAMSETLQLLILQDPHDIDRLVEIPECFTNSGGTAASPSEEDKAGDKGKRKQGSGISLNGHAKEVDLWILEHLRRLPIDLNPLVTSLLPACNRETCPEMRAGEWQYICVAHSMSLSGGGGGMGGGAGTGGSDASVNGDAGGGDGRECCAIDYILHTIDSHTALLNSSHAFPSRLTIKPGSERHFPQQLRRLSRIFAHAYHHHRDIFMASEAETSLYARFFALTQRYGLVGEELLNVPKEAVEGFTKGGRSDEEDDKQGDHGDGLRNEQDEEDNKEDDYDRGQPAATEDEGDEDDDADFRRDDVPATSMKVGGTLGRSAGRNAGKTRRTLFPVDVVDEKDDEDEAAEEEEAEVPEGNEVIEAGVDGDKTK